MAAINNAVHSVQLPQAVETVTNGGMAVKGVQGKDISFVQEKKLLCRQTKNNNDQETVY